MARVKICGVTRVEDAERAVELGAWAIGLNHWEDSPRRVDPATAAEIGTRLRRQAEIAGVFVNASLEEIAAAVEDEGLTMVQLHGDEGPSFCAEVARKTGSKVIKVLRVRSAADVRAAETYRTDFHMFDTHRKASPGGTGESFDWELVAGRVSSVPMILAGGLNPGNVAEAISVARPFAVDVASGVETAPGRKDPELLERFFAEVGSAIPV